MGLADSKHRERLPAWYERLGSSVGPWIAVALFVAAAWLLHAELERHSWREIAAEMAAVPANKVATAMALTALNYLILSGYDWLALRYLGRMLRAWQVLLGAFVGYTMSYNFGWMLGGPTVRYRLYSAWGFSTVEIVKLVAMLAATFWAGLHALAGLVFLIDPLAIPARLHLPLATTFWLGPLLLAEVAAYLLACAFFPRIRLWGWELELPPLALSLAQIAVAAIDLIVAAGVLYVLLPPPIDMGFWMFLNVFLLATVVSIISHIPGGVGVFELVILTLLAPEHPAQLAGALLVYRAIYYLLPLMLAVALLGGHELMERKAALRQISGRVGKWAPQVIPRVLAGAAFVAGALLLLSGATPAEHDRLAWLKRHLPLGVLEASHFLGSIVGVVLLLLARGLQRRLDSAYWLALALLTAGIVASLLKGFDYEESIYLALMLAALVPCRAHFYRKSSLFQERLSRSWLIAMLLVLVCTLWLTLFAFKHVEYSHDLWWRFAFTSDAPRTLRALAGVLVVVLVAALLALLRAKHSPPAAPTADELAAATTIARRWPRTYAQLVALGDKSLLFNGDRSAFLMFGVEGRSWVVLGDPVGPEDAAEELAWEFRELCDEGGRWPVFYQVERSRLPLYIDLGLSMLKLGEEARIPLADFSLEGRSRKSLRHICSKLEREGCSLELVEPPHAVPLMEELASISSDWLKRKNTREKRFSIGFFERSYVAQSTLALVRQADTVVAFANVLRGGEHEELSVDLMRFSEAAPGGTMDFLFSQLMLSGRADGYRWFNLGMAPLAGVEARPLAPAWNRVAQIVFRHGEHFYNFQGLRDYKAKFDPVWEPRFLASPGGLRLPLILTNIATLISAGTRGLVGR